MGLEFDMPDEEICVWLNVHDRKTNSNYTAELRGTFAEIEHLGRKSAKFMDEAGFVPGWLPTGKYCGSIAYIVLAREAVERCWHLQDAGSDANAAQSGNSAR
jgi:hypothetical protein